MGSYGLVTPSNQPIDREVFSFPYITNDVPIPFYSIAARPLVVIPSVQSTNMISYRTNRVLSIDGIVWIIKPIRNNMMTPNPEFVEPPVVMFGKLPFAPFVRLLTTPFCRV